MLLTLYVHVHTALRTSMASAAGHHRLHRRTDERGQATAEYALVLLGAAAVAALLAGWAAKTGKVGDLLDFVLDRLLGDAKKGR